MENKNSQVHNAQRGKEEIFKYFFLLCSVLSIIFIILMCLFIFKDSFVFMGKVGIKNFILNESWRPMDEVPSFGILSMIVGSLFITFLSCICAVPIGVMVSAYMAYDCNKKLYRILKPALNLMAGIPSIVYGFFALNMIVPLVKVVFGGKGMSILAASILLLIMILPTIVAISEAALRAVPKSFYEGSLSLGATHDQTITQIMIPAAKSGIFAGVILGVGRAIGETMAVILVAGNQARITFDITKGIRTMTTNIVLEMGYAAGLHRDALIATAAVLFIFILIINLSFFMIKKRSEQL